MYKPNGFRSSFSRGASQNNRFSRRPFRGGRFYNPNRFSNKKKPSALANNPSLFVKKATPNTPQITYTPHNSFADFAIASPLKQNIISREYSEPTPIQDQAIEPILQGRDLIGLANTGTGKTAAFLIPLIDKIFKDRDQKALIIVPTRELALQINDELHNFAKGMSIYSALIIGGANIGRQIHDIRRNPHFVIGTPGRLKDLIQRKLLNLNDFSIFVLDEVDLMVDIGFINDVRYFISLLPSKRQSLFFSATIPPKVKEILSNFVHNPVTISVKKQDTPENIDQDVIKVINKDKKVDQLHDLLIKDGFDKVLIFGRTKHGIEKLNRELEFRGFRVGAIHGNKTQGHRQRPPLQK